MHAQRRTDLQITESEMAHHIAMLSRTHEVRRRLHAYVRTPADAPARPLRIAESQTPDADVDAGPQRHPLDATLYSLPLRFPAYAPKGEAKFGGPNWPRETVKEIIAECARLAGVTPDDVRSSKRTTECVRPRLFAMWRIRTSAYVKRMSLPEIGRQFGGRDHSTAFNAIRKIDAAIAAGILDPANPQPWFALGYNDGRVRRSPK